MPGADRSAPVAVNDPIFDNSANSDHTSARLGECACWSLVKRWLPSRGNRGRAAPGVAPGRVAPRAAAPAFTPVPFFT